MWGSGGKDKVEGGTCVGVARMWVEGGRTRESLFRLGVASEARQEGVQAQSCGRVLVVAESGVSASVLAYDRLGCELSSRGCRFSVVVGSVIALWRAGPVRASWGQGWNRSDEGSWVVIA